jgi:cation diffusion facilitator CzcD-associated flavoprotein CzcO
MSRTRTSPSPTSATTTSVRVAIIGAGFAGLCAAIRMKQVGLHDFVILERGNDVGGTWRDNTYPGAACDVPSHLYSFSFAPNPDWTRSFSPQGEIQAYLRRCATDFGILPHVRFEEEVTSADWDDDRQRWVVTTGKGVVEAQFLIGAMGALSEPAVPKIPGLETFEGETFHSAEWRHDLDLRGRRVASIGTGASAIQYVPEIAPAVAQLDVYQRTPPWIIPRTDRAISRGERWLYRRLPALQRLVRASIYWSRELYALGFTRTGGRRLMRLPEAIARKHLERQVPDPDLRARLVPGYAIGCKRILISNDYYPALTRENVSLVTDGIREIRPRSILTADGVERPADTIIFGTGFAVTDIPAARRIRGRGGLLLGEAWSEGMQAHKGTTVAGFPNFFMLIGPNTGLGHTSMVYMMEAQVNYVLDGLRQVVVGGIDALEVRPEAQAASNAALQEKMRDTVWTTGGCASWYLDSSGHNTTLWPDFTFRFRRGTRRFDIAAYTEPPPVAHRRAPAEDQVA